MNTELNIELTVEKICEGFVYNEYEGKGLFGLAGRLTIQPEYQRNYIYADGKKDVASPKRLLMRVESEVQKTPLSAVVTSSHISRRITLPNIDRAAWISFRP